MQVFDVKDFKENYNLKCEIDIFTLLTNMGLSQLLIRKLNVNNLFKYLNGNRTIVVSQNSKNNVVIYITTGKERSKSCLLTVGSDFIKVEEAKYRRVGNGTNQDGIVVTRIYSLVNNEIKEDSYAISLAFDEAKTARLTYFGDITNFNHAYFAIPVTSKTLEAKGVNAKITETLEHNMALSLFRIPYLEGENLINDNHVIVSKEDIELSFEKNLCL